MCSSDLMSRRVNVINSNIYMDCNEKFKLSALPVPQKDWTCPTNLFQNQKEMHQNINNSLSVSATTRCQKPESRIVCVYSSQNDCIYQYSNDYDRISTRNDLINDHCESYDSFAWVPISLVGYPKVAFMIEKRSMIMLVFITGEIGLLIHKSTENQNHLFKMLVKDKNLREQDIDNS